MKVIVITLTAISISMLPSISPQIDQTKLTQLKEKTVLKSVKKKQRIGREEMSDKVIKTDKQWRKELTPFQYTVLRKKGTERPFTGKYNKHFEKGVYICAGCGNELFVSESKFDSHCGWPSFTAPADKDSVEESIDRSHFMVRTEITCSKCGGHLGHVFNDGPEPTGLRYCINSAALDFQKDQ